MQMRRSFLLHSSTSSCLRGYLSVVTSSEWSESHTPLGSAAQEKKNKDYTELLVIIFFQRGLPISGSWSLQELRSFVLDKKRKKRARMLTSRREPE